MRNRKRIVLSIFIGLILIIAACSGSNSQPTDDSDNEVNDVRVVKVFMSEFSFFPSVIDVEVGETVKFIVVNDGVAFHEFEIITQNEIDEHLNADHGDHQKDNESEEVENLKIGLEADKMGELVITFDKVQELYFVCLVPGHYEAGMVGEFDFGEEHEDDGHSEEADDDHEEHEDEH